jgi:SAM-dependent methyltransferase
MVELIRHSYRYYPYELELARREVETLLPEARLSDTARGICLQGGFDKKTVERLVYFSAAKDGEESAPTMQAQLERVNGNGVNRQSTRYSAHGLHEYKGKFNPQIARAILNILNVPLRARIIDPFCGSGTSLLECAHLGMRAVGTDINPLAVFIANAKLDAVRVPADELRRELVAALKRHESVKLTKAATDDVRRDYLLSWFDADVFGAIERMRLAIEGGNNACSAPLLALASNLLRDYSLQDPHDLRIRRRKTPVPEKPFVKAFEDAALQFLAKLEAAQSVFRRSPAGSKALLLDSRKLDVKKLSIGSEQFDCALTSPPYATALPYIDTQRLSLVWLGLVAPAEILPLEARLVGSREVRGQSKRELLANLTANSAGLPKTQAKYCWMLQSALSDDDGFRRQAVPLLLYRYFAGMAQVFRALRPAMTDGAPFALIVGSNHTVLSGRRFDINTPQHLAELAAQNGWEHVETVPLQTYQRYGYHMENAVVDEGLVIVRAA